MLKETAPKAKILHQDALQYQPPNTPYKLVANVPYYITSPIINHFLQATNPPTTLTLLIQKEVADKIIQTTPKMTVLSLQVALFADAQIVAKVPKGAFHPSPKVDSAIIHLTTHHKIPREEAISILDLAKKAFTSGRKKLSNTIPEYKDKLLKLNLQDQRPQHLSLEDWQKLIKPL